MKSMRIIAPVLVAVCLLVVPLAWSQGGNVEEQIAALDDQVLQAYLKADTSFLEKHLADDYAAIYAASGKLYTKAQDIESITSGDLKYEAIDVRERKIRVYGDTAVVIRLVSSKGTRSGKPFSADFRTTGVWVKHKGNWKVVAFQATRVVSTSQPARSYINLPNRPVQAPFSDGVLVGDTLYIAGRIGIDPKTGKPPEDLEQEIKILIDGIKATLQEAGMTMDDLVFVQVFCADVSLYDKFNSAYRSYFGKEYPARAFVGSGPLLRGAHFEMLGVAVKR
jgi:2-iminobutanoate/2-iminopropanoate deaminase